MGHMSLVGATDLPQVRLNAMSGKEIYDDPSKVEADAGHVSVEGPDHVDVQLTPEAAEETGDRLLSESIRARGQRRLKDFPQPEKRT